MSRTVLIVDDSKTERVVLSGFLKAEYDILEAKDGAEALAILRKKFRSLSAIVMDVVMPGMDGFQTLKAIKENAIWLNIPVIIATVLDDEESREKAISYGADNFVTKPFNRKLLLHVVRNAVRLRETASIANTLWRDPLTGLLNRESFFKEAERMIRRHEPGYYMLSCFDVENFKVINDQYGAETGDAVLKHIANCLVGFIGGINGLSGRYMADKFAILYPAAMKDSRKVRDNHALASSPECVIRPIRIRIGRYAVRDLSLPVSAMFDRAAMAESMVKGRYDTYVAEYTEAMRDELLHEQQIVNDMVGALKNGEFEPWFQPQYNHATGALVGAEALVRWRKDGRIVPPLSFIPVFEKNGFIYEVDQFVWRQVCACLRRWLDEGRNPPPVSVNISRYDLYQKDFLDALCGLVKEYRLPPDLLRLEITESAFAGSAKTVVSAVKALIAEGFTVEIDDFGSGYSSLNTLKDVPASILKLDMKFFENTENSQRGGNIVESVVRMAKWLGMSVIAEGVENKAQADYLKTIGCYYIQGYYYARPMPAEEYEKRLDQGEKEQKLSRMETLETLDNNLFWDPKSMETLIFNSYVGGACIFEYYGGETELLRVNDQYIRELGGLIPDGARLNESGFVRFLDSEGKEALTNALREAAEQKKQSACEVRLANGTHVEFVRITVRMIASTHERMLFYTVLVNMTQQREAERKQAESAERLRVIMGNINGSVSAILMDEIGNTKLIFGNDKYYEILGYTKEQAEEIRLDTLSCIVPEDYDAVVAKLNQLKKDGHPISIDYRAQKRDGSFIYIRSDSSRMSMEGYGDEVIVSVETDITEKRTLEDQLRAIVDNINGGVSATYLKNGAPKYVIVNDKYFDIIGYTREQFETEVANVFDLVHPDDRERVDKLFRDAARDRKPYTMEYRVIRRNGAVRHILCNTNVMHFFGVEEPVQLAVSNDITVLRQAQQKEHSLSVQLKTIMENIHGGVTAAVLRDNENEEIVFANDGFYEMYGYTREQYDKEAPGAFGLILPEDRERTMETVARIVRERGSATYEYRCRKRDGSVMWTQVAGAVISMADVGDTVLLSIVTDITALRRAEQQNLATMDRLKTVMNAIPNGVTAVAFHGDHTEFLFANDRYYEMHGIAREENAQHSLGESLAMVDPDDRPLLRQRVMSATRPGQSAQAEYRIRRPDGTVRWTRAVIRVTNLVGIGVPVQVAVFTDIHAEREAADQLRFLNDSAHDILAQPDSDLAINKTLENLMAYFDGDRAYVIELNREKMTTSNTYEKCAPGVASEMEALRNLPFAESDFWFDTLNRGEFIAIPDVAALGDDKAELRAMLQMQEIRSVIVAPLRRDGALVGFVGMDNPGRAIDQLDHLEALADYIAVLLTRRDLKRKIDRIGHDVTAQKEKGSQPELMTASVSGGLAADSHVSQQEMNFKALLPYLFSTIMESSTNLAFAKDVNFRYLCCSKTFVGLLGLMSEKDVVGKTDYELFPKETADMIRRDDSELFSTGKPRVDILEAIPSPDGTRHYTRTTKHLLRAASGEIMGIYCIGRDVTEIREAYAQLQLLTNSIPGGIATFHCTKKEIRLTYFNDGYCELFGYTREEYQKSDSAPLDAVFAEDRPVIDGQLERLIGDGTRVDCIFRVRTRDGGYKWVNCQAAAVERIKDVLVVNVVLTDMTEQQEEKERLRLAEEEYRIATMHSNRTIGRYSIATQTLTLAEDIATRFALPQCMPDVPYGRVRLGKISKDTQEAYIAFFESIRRGEKECSATFCKLLNDGWRWIEAHATTLFDGDGKPVSAIISYTDVTEQREKEAVYSRWKNSLAGRPEDSYTLFRCNLSKSASYESWTGKLLRINFDMSKQTFDERTGEYVEQCVYAEDRERYRAFMRADTMLAEYYRGHRNDAIEFRECDASGNVRWLRLSVDLVEYPDSKDVEAYLMYENIDEQKRRQLKTIERAETDPLTGVLNRATFAVRVNQIISTSRPNACHALLMLDMDSFKQVNDVFGHGAGDQALTDVADALTKASRKGDLVGRLGGDEFLVFLPDISGEAAAAKKARQICEVTRKAYSMDVQISASIGIALYPQDGEGFESLYKIADKTLYRVKDTGKNDYAFSHDAAPSGADARPGAETAEAPRTPEKKVRRMLVVDDNATDNALLCGMFTDTFRVEKAAGGAAALAKLRHYGSAISVVLLDLMMPGVDGFEVLRRMQGDAGMRTIPVVVVSGDEKHETALSAIREGAADYVTKPVDVDILRIRVESAVSKAENERLRAQNSYLSLRNSEVSSYKSALERSGILVITLDWVKNEFAYSPSVSRRLAGQYDGRNFWRVLLSGMVTDSQTVRKMQHLVHDLADDRERMEDSMFVRLKTAFNLSRMFEMNAFKEAGDDGLTEKIIITLREMTPVLNEA